jgi:O-antigen ligase
MATLPVLLVALVVGSAMAQHCSRAKLVALALAVTACCAGLGWATPSVRERFAEGFREVASYNSAADVNTSWGMRLKMMEQTVQMAAERPVVGQGLGSWEALWVKRVPSGSMLAEQRTPHNEHLLVAAQTGLVGLTLWLCVVWSNATRGLRTLGVQLAPATLLVWSAVAWAGLFNVVLRDAKFSVPLLILAALAHASGRSDRSH